MSMRLWTLWLGLTLTATLMGCASVPDGKRASVGHYTDGAAQPATVSDAALLSDLEETPVEFIEAYLEPTLPERASEVTSTSGTDAVLPGPADADLAEGRVAQPSEPSGVYDPWERFNRRMHRFNNVVDRSVARPVAKAYVRVLPAPVRSKVSNFFDNLGQPATAVNALLQGRVKHSAQAMGRFLVNSTIGVAGLFDPAARMKIPEREEDFGQTLAIWGWKRSRYLELPFFGPSSIRDAFGIAGDSPLQPVAYVEADKVRIGLEALNLVDMRARLIQFDSLRNEAQDDYLLVRDLWAQRRNFQITEGEDNNASLPDYLKECPTPLMC